MKRFRFQPLYRMIQLSVVISTFFCISCADFTRVISNDNGEPSDKYVIADMPIVDVEVLIAESDPVQIFISVTGQLEGCTVHHETHDTRDGNTITIKMTTITTTEEALNCLDTVRLYQETVRIGTLPLGDYHVIVNGVERQFRVD